MAAMREYRIQLKDAITGKSIITAGGVCHVATNGSPDKATIYDKDGAALSNPLTPTRGFINFFTLATVSMVDLYIMAPGGQFVCLTDIAPGGPNEINVDTQNKMQVAKIPFSIADATANTEKDTGFNTGTDKMWLPSPVIKVTTLDGSMTIDVGTDGSGANDPDGFVDGVALDSAVSVKATLLASGDTFGALLSVLDSANSGDDAPEGYIDSADEDITYTLSASTDTGKGFIILPYMIL